MTLKADGASSTRTNEMRNRFRGFSLWRALVYGLALSGLAYAVHTIEHASLLQQANVVGYLSAGPLLFVTLGAFCNLFSGRKIGPSVAAILIVVVTVLAVIGVINGWFDTLLHYYHLARFDAQQAKF